MPPGWVGLLLLAAIPCAFAVWVWVRLSGWRRLARAYPAIDVRAARRFRLRTARVGGIRFGGCVTFAVDPDYLHLSLIPPFNAGLAGMSVPWADVRSRDERVFFQDFVAFEFARMPRPALRVSKRLALELIRAAQAPAPANDPLAF